MKKNVSILLGALVTAASFGGCGTDAPPPVANNAPVNGTMTGPSSVTGAPPTTMPGTGTMVVGTAPTVGNMPTAPLPTDGSMPPPTAAPTDGSVPPPATAQPTTGVTAMPTGMATAAPPAAVACTNTDKTTIPIDETGWVNRECTDYGIQGSWYCYDDGVNESGCPAAGPPFVAGRGMCLTGSTSDDSSAWGAGIGFSLNDSGEADGMASVKSPFDAAAAGIIGFEIEIDGDTGGNEIRVAFKINEEDDVAPFDAVPGADTYQVMIENAEVPSAWEVPNAGDVADATHILDIQIQIAGGEAVADYDFCVKRITPITDGSAPMPGEGTVSTYGQQICGAYDTINIGPYTVQNNRYGSNSHCVQALFDNGRKGGFKLSGVSANVETGAAPGSYPSLVYGWHVNGMFYGEYQSAKQLSAIGSIPSTMSVTVPGAGNSYNTSYDNWINSSPTAGSSGGTLEQMIWLNFQDTTPIGSKVDTVSLAGTSWDVWYGTHDGFSTVSYIRATNTNTIDFDIKEFMDDTVSRNYATSASYLLGIQAGFEIWRSTSEFSVDSFSVSVN